MRTKINKIIILLLLMLSFGCKTVEKNTKIVSKNDSIRVEYRDRFLKDSIYIKDSIFIEKKADTVYINNFKIRYLEKIRLEKDTIEVGVNKVDSVIINVVEYKNKKITSFSSFWILILIIVLLSCFIIIYFGFKWYKKSHGL